MIELVKEIKEKLNNFISFNLLLNLLVAFMCVIGITKIFIIEDKVNTIQNTIQQFYIDAENKNGCLSDTIK